MRWAPSSAPSSSSSSSSTLTAAKAPAADGAAVQTDAADVLTGSSAEEYDFHTLFTALFGASGLVAF